MATAAKLLILIRVGANFVKNQNKQASFDARIFYITTRLILGELKAMFFYHHTDHFLELIEFYSMPVSHSKNISIPLLWTFSAVSKCTNMTARTRRRLWKHGANFISGLFCETCKSVSHALIPHRRRRRLIERLQIRFDALH